ncbi:ATP-binding protein [Paenibacillus tuaregi]|uniref:ATP-binding protein n=1 Tax=Paenibacillus tuaregi TaxID=1816681 RepID=UPI00083883E6|nr:ATP-binding protein [Paenibacillus tuaregi]
MKRQWLWVLISMGLVFIFPISMMISIIQSSPLKPQAQGGYLDLSDWDFQSRGRVELKGEWEFYRSQLLKPQDFQRAAAGAQRPNLSGLVQVPGEWNAYISSDGRPASLGYGTYRLRIKLRDQTGSHIYGIRTDSIRMSNRVYINGQEVGASGNPSPGGGSSGNIPFTAFFPLRGSIAEIVVQVANYSYSSGGIITPILFGDGTSVLGSYQASLLEDLITGIGFLLFSLHFLYVFRNRKHEYASLPLSGLCVAGLVYVLTHGQKLIGVIVPGLSYEIILRIQLIAATLVYFFLVRYVAASIPQVISRRAIVASNLLTAVQIGAGILLPARIFSEWDMLVLAYGFACVSYIFYVMLKGMRQYTGHSILMLTGGLSLLAIIIVKLFNVSGVLQSDVFVIYEILIFVSVQTLLLSKRFTDSYREAENLSNRLLTLDGLKDELMVNTSHELRTPLHAIVNISESMLGGAAGPLSPAQAEHVSLVASTGKRLALLIDGLLDFTRLRAGDMELKLGPVDLSSTIRTVWEVISLTALNKEIRFIQKWPEDLPKVYMDEGRLQQILLKLLSNAVRYTDRGEITVSAWREEDRVSFTVEDTGVGMPAPYVSELSELFSRRISPLLNEYSVPGLGLRVVSELIKLAGGSIEVKSVEGSGTAFRVTLPVAEEGQSAEMDREQPPFPSAGKDRRVNPSEAVPSSRFQVMPRSMEEANGDGGEHEFTVLIVDDDPVNLKVLESLLHVESYHVIPVASGQAALNEIKANPRIDLIILDWMMPGMSGLELCRTLRGTFMLAELPVLMLTARSSPEDVQAGFEAGINDFLSKPVNGVELRARVRTLLQLKQSVQTAVRTEMAFLQAQIKPHFLYNALNTMIALCPVDPDKTMRMLLELSQYLRGSFDFRNRDQLVPLHKEMELVESYIYLEKARFEDRLQMEYTVEGDLQVMIPPLSIQPIVENAVRHGVMERAAGGRVHLQITVMKEKVQVTVTDNGVGMTPEQLEVLLSPQAPQRGVGLRNIHQRLKTLNYQGLHIESQLGQGTSVSFELPSISVHQASRE